jgi:hypothetical protein
VAVNWAQDADGFVGWGPGPENLSMHSMDVAELCLAADPYGQGSFATLLAHDVWLDVGSACDHCYAVV